MYALDYSALDRGWATQGAADYCEAHGHASYTVDGVNQGICPRCLAVTETQKGSTMSTHTPGIETAVRAALRELECYTLYAGMADAASLGIRKVAWPIPGRYVAVTDGKREVILLQRQDGTYLPWSY